LHRCAGGPLIPRFHSRSGFMVPAGIVALLNCFIGQGFINNSADYVRSSQSVPPLAFIVMNDTAGGGNATLFGGCAVSQLTLLTQDVCEHFIRLPGLESFASDFESRAGAVLLITATVPTVA